MPLVVARMTSSDGGATFGAYKEILAPFEQPFKTLQRRRRPLRPRRLSHLGFGDGGSGRSAGQRAEDDQLLLQDLRIDVDGGDPYAIPDGNPWKAGGGEPGDLRLRLPQPLPLQHRLRLWRPVGG